jgi:hypothetical protein
MKCVALVVVVCVIIMDTVGLFYPLRKLGTFPLSMSVMSQGLALLQGVPRLRTASSDLWPFV